MPSLVDDALDSLRAAIAATVRQEQLRDRLTGLGNDEALDDLLKAAVAPTTEEDYWVAFIEVDRFKRINDVYGYENADVILKKIADHLRNAVQHNLPANSSPFRAHGDEFYLAGPASTGTPEQVETALEALRRNVECIHWDVGHEDGPIRCTVSIGWMMLSDVQAAKLDLVLRQVRIALELAVAEAKIDRNCVRRFSAEMTKRKMVDGRSDCPACQTKFSYLRPVDVSAPERLVCPVCAVACE